MAAPQTPPPEDISNAQTFLGTLDEVECCICEEAFSDTHAPMITPTCHHIFGSHCLRAWVLSENRSHNRCPLCRTVLFDDGLPLVEEDARLEDNAHHEVDEPVWARGGLAMGAEAAIQAQHRHHHFHQHIIHGGGLHPRFAVALDHEAEDHVETIMRGAVQERAVAQESLLASLRPYPSTGTPAHPPVPVTYRPQSLQSSQWVNWVNHWTLPFDQDPGHMPRPHHSNDQFGVGAPRHRPVAAPLPLHAYGVDAVVRRFPDTLLNTERFQQAQLLAGGSNESVHLPLGVRRRTPGPAQGGFPVRDLEDNFRGLPVQYHRHAEMARRAHQIERQAAELHFRGLFMQLEAQRQQRDGEVADVGARAATGYLREQLRRVVPYPGRVDGLVAHAHRVRENVELARAAASHERLADEDPSFTQNHPSSRHNNHPHRPLHHCRPITLLSTTPQRTPAS